MQLYLISGSPKINRVAARMRCYYCWFLGCLLDSIAARNLCLDVSYWILTQSVSPNLNFQFFICILTVSYTGLSDIQYQRWMQKVWSMLWALAGNWKGLWLWKMDQGLWHQIKESNQTKGLLDGEIQSVSALTLLVRFAIIAYCISATSESAEAALASYQRLLSQRVESTGVPSLETTLIFATFQRLRLRCQRRQKQAEWWDSHRSQTHLIIDPGKLIRRPECDMPQKHQAADCNRESRVQYGPAL